MGLFDYIPDAPAPDVPSAAERSGVATPPGMPRITVTPSDASGGAPPLDDTSRDMLVRTVLGEAAAEPHEGKAAVAAVIRNRLNSGKFGNTPADVVLAKNQFEPWSTSQGRNRMMSYAKDSPEYGDASAAVERVFGEEGFDPTEGATHFYSPTAQAALGRNPPKWAQGEPTVIGRHNFYRLGDNGPGATDFSAQSKRPAALVAATGQGDVPPPGAPQGTGGLFDYIPDAPPDTSTPSDGAGGQFAAPLPDGRNFRVAREGESPPVATPAEAAKGGFLRSATFNFRDELNGLAAAGGLDPNDPDVVHAMAALAKGAYRKANGDPEADAAYRVRVSQDRDEAQRQQEQQPGASLAGELGGAAASIPFGGAAGRGLSLGERAVQGARTGATIGAINGVGEGTDPQSRAVGGVTGAATGGIVGAAAPAAVEGVVRTGRGIAAAAQPVVNTIRGARDPEGEAARRVVGALQRDTRVAGGPPGLTAPEFAGSVNSGGPAAVVDLGGETTRALARSAANTSPEARAALGGTINDRFESQSDRVAGWLNRTFGPSDTGATREALQTASQQANRPAYARAYRDGDQPLWSPELQRLVSSPDVVDAMRAASEKGKSRAVVDGFGGFNSSVQVSPSGVVEFTKGKNGVPTYPNLQFWDYTRRALSDAADKAGRAGGKEEASVLNQLAGKLNGELDTLVPSYRAARQGAARFFGADDALDAGQKFLTSNMPIADAARAFNRMSGPEQALFQHGFVQSLTQKIESTGDRRNVLNTIAQSPRAREQMELAMGPQGAREFEAMMRVEGVMDMARTAVQGNSTTARQLAELGLAGGAYGIGSGGDITNPHPSALMTAALAYGAAKGKGAIDRRVAQRVGEMLASNDVTVLRRGVAMVARNQNLFNSLRSFDQGVARVGGEQAAGIPAALQSITASRADGQQPEVPRPAAQ